MNAELRQPFGEGNSPSESEALLAGTSFHRMVDYTLTAAGEYTHEDVAYGVVLHRGLDLKISTEGHPAMKARVIYNFGLGSGEYDEGVHLYEPGATDEEWGPKICHYISGSGDKRVLRYDAPSAEARQLASGDTDDTVPKQVETSLENLSADIAMGTNGAPVGAEEVSVLRDLLSISTPLSYDNPDD